MEEGGCLNFRHHLHFPLPYAPQYSNICDGRYGRDVLQSGRAHPLFSQRPPPDNHGSRNPYVLHMRPDCPPLVGFFLSHFLPSRFFRTTPGTENSDAIIFHSPWPHNVLQGHPSHPNGLTRISLILLSSFPVPPSAATAYRTQRKIPFRPINSPTAPTAVQRSAGSPTCTFASKITLFIVYRFPPLIACSVVSVFMLTILHHPPQPQ